MTTPANPGAVDRADAQARFAMRNVSLHPWNKPVFANMPGQAFSYGKLYRLENLSGGGDRFGKGSYAELNFLYNPTTVQSSTSLNTAWDWERSSGVTPPPAELQSYDFSLFLNRTEDAATGRVTNGTLHDIEILWRVLNGKPERQANGEITSDIGYILATEIDVVLGSRFRFKGYCTGVSIQHAKFDPSMTPVISEVGLSFTRIVPGVDTSTGDPFNSFTEGSESPTRVQGRGGGGA